MTISEINRRNKEEWPLGSIITASLASGQNFFNPLLMRIVGDVRSNFSVLCNNEKIYVKRKHPAIILPALLEVGQCYEFDAQSGLLSMREIHIPDDIAQNDDVLEVADFVVEMDTVAH